MGKKTFEEIGKLLLVTIITILVSVMATRRVLLDSKLDKSTFKEYKTEHNERHDRERQDIKEIKEMVMYLYEKEIDDNE